MDELARALDERRPIFSVIARACNWQVDERLKDEKAAVGGNPVCDPENDAIWKDVIRDLEEAAKTVLSDRTQKNFTIKENFLTKMSEIGHPFFTKRREKLLLEQVFVFPDLRVTTSGREGRKVNSEFLLNLTKWNGIVTVHGKSMSGKTALAQKIFAELVSKKHYPLIVGGEVLNQPRSPAALKKACKLQYNEHDLFWGKENYAGRVLIVDDYHKSRISVANKRTLLRQLLSQFPRILIFVDEYYDFDEIFNQESPGELVATSGYQILEMGSHLRSALIEKWVKANEPPLVPAPADDLRIDADRIKKSVDAILGRGDFVPRHPFYILGTVQKMEILGDYPGEPVTLFGHCYHALITAALWRAKVEQSDVHAYFNYLTHLAGHMYDKNIDGISHEMLLRFTDEDYNFLKPASLDAMLEKLHEAEIIRKENDHFFFCYDYMRFFFAAKKIAENIDTNGNADIVDNLCDAIEARQVRHIMLFIIYHTKSPLMMEKILSFVKGLVRDHDPASMTAEELRAFKGFHVPKNFLHMSNEVEQNREAMHDAEDLQEQEEKEWQEEIESENSESRKHRVEFSHVMTAVEMVGQILRNHYGDLDKGQLLSFYNEAQLAGLRFLGKFITSFDVHKDQFREGLLKIMDDLKIPESERENEVKEFMGLLFAGAVRFVLEKIGKEMGYSKILPISKEARDMNQGEDGRVFPSVDLIYAHVRLWNPEHPQQRAQNAKAVVDLVERGARSLEKNPIARSIFTMMVKDYIAIYDLPAPTKQQIASALDIKVTEMRQLPKIKGK